MAFLERIPAESVDRDCDVDDVDFALSLRAFFVFLEMGIR
jgi:hypothetical protein